MHRVVLCLAYSLTPRGATSVNRVALIFCRIPVESRAAVNGTVSDAGNVLLPIALCSAMSGVCVAAASDVHEFDPSRRHVGKPWCPDFCKIPVESRAAGNGTVSDAGNVLLPIALCSAMSGVYVAAVPSDVHEFDPSRRHVGKPWCLDFCRNHVETRAAVNGARLTCETNEDLLSQYNFSAESLEALPVCFSRRGLVPVNLPEGLSDSDPARRLLARRLQSLQIDIQMRWVP